MDKSEKIDAYFGEEHFFKKGICILRALALGTNLNETYKWNFPTYTINSKNVLAICKFNSHFGIWFFNGVFLSDPKKYWKMPKRVKLRPCDTGNFTHWRILTGKW